MKRICKSVFNMFILFLLVILVIAVIFSVTSVILYINLDAEAKNSREFYLSNYEFADNCYVNPLIIQGETNTSSGEAANYNTYTKLVNRCLAKYPENIRPYIADNWAIVFTPTVPEAYEKYANANISYRQDAVTILEIQTIFVFTSDPQTIYGVLVHEFGHVLAYEYGCIEYTDEFENLYFLFRESHTEAFPFADSRHAVNSSTEFFATAMATYVTNSDELWLKAPGAADYIEKLLKKEPYKTELGKFTMRIRGLKRIN